MKPIRLALALTCTAACLDAGPDDAPLLDETAAELNLEGDTPYTGFSTAVIPEMFRGADWRVRIVGVNTAGQVAYDVQPDPGIWGTPAPSVVSTPLTARHVAAAEDAWGRTVVFAVFGGNWLMRTQQTQPGARTFLNWAYVDTAVLDRDPALAVNQDGRLELYYVAANGVVKTAWQATPGGAWSNPIATAFTTTATPELARDRQHRLELFVPRATAPCGVQYTRQRAPNGPQGWMPVQTFATPCLSTVAVGYADNATDVLGQTAAGRIHHYTRDASDLLFRVGLADLNGDRVAPPLIVTKDDGRLFAFTGITGCPTGAPVGSLACRNYYATQRESGAWWAWQPFARPVSTAHAVAGADSIINNTYLLLAKDSATQYQRALFRY